jgi:hypothetical protein
MLLSARGLTEVNTVTAHEEQTPALKDLGDDGDRISITDVNGTVARFEMTYSPLPGERLFFGPPRSARIPGFAFLAFALVLVALEVLAYTGSSNSRLYVWLVEGDRGRPLPSVLLAGIVLVSALGTVLRTHLRGVVVRGDGLEARYLVALGLPRIKKWAWAQIHRMVVDERQVMLELWDNSYEKLPPVGDFEKMRATLEAVAAARRIPITRLNKLR